MTDEPIDFERAKERRDDKAIDADQAEWERFNLRLTEIMVAAELSSVGLTSATLRALLDVLMSREIELENAKQCVGRVLNAFFDSKRGKFP